MIGTQDRGGRKCGRRQTQPRREGKGLARWGETRAAEVMCQECKGRLGDE